MIKTRPCYTFSDPFIAAASGLAIADGHFFIVSDDELSLLKLSLDLSQSTKIDLFPGKLPEDYMERKKLKPDLEAIVYLETEKLILCLPSGSRPNRTQGATIDLQNGVRTLSLNNTYQKLNSLIDELNIEGAYIVQNDICLIQRGNGKGHFNALIRMDLKDFLLDKAGDISITQVNLGNLEGVPLSFTDGIYHDGHMIYVAVAEDTQSTYLDGVFKGAVLGRWDGNKIIEQVQIDITSKPEGLALSSGILYFVTDDDDRKKTSRLFSSEFRR